MKRTPSINILETDLETILSELLKVSDSPIKWDTKKLAKEVARRAAEKPALQRSISISNDRVEKKLTSAKRSSTGDTKAITLLLVSLRKSMKHRNVKQILEDDKDWSTCKKIAENANLFCQEFGLVKDKGYREYVHTALKLLESKNQGFAVNRIPINHDAIVERYEALSQLNEANEQEMEYATEAFEIYRSMILDRVGFCEDYSENPMQMVWFYRVAKKCLELNIEPIDFLASHFESFDYFNSVPEPRNLLSEKTLTRLMKYMAKKKKEPKKVTPSKIDMTRFKGPDYKD